MSNNTSKPHLLPLETKIVRAQGILASAIDDEMVMANLKTDTYYGLDPVSTRIWQLIETPQALAAICETLVTEFTVDLETCQREVAAFVQELLDAQIATIAQA